MNESNGFFHEFYLRRSKQEGNAKTETLGITHLVRTQNFCKTNIFSPWCAYLRERIKV